MAKLLMMEGNIKKSRDRADSLGVRWASQVYSDAISAHFPEIKIDTVCAADPGASLPDWCNIDDYDGLVIGGSGLHAYDTDPAVTNQIELLKCFAETGKPILGSCWGLQIAVIAAGGRVGLSPNGREIVFARKIRLTEDGKNHPFMAGRAPYFDVPCIHYDEVTELPANATLLCSNDHSLVQGAIVPVGNSRVWAVQYHPEFDLLQLEMLLRFYGQDMFEQGFVDTQTELDILRGHLSALTEDPSRKAPAWQLGIDGDILNDDMRRAEIINWVNYEILKQPFARA